MRFLFGILVFIVVSFSQAVFAGIEYCGSTEDLKIDRVWVQSKRDDNSVFANKLVVTLKKSDGSRFKCYGKSYTIIENTDPAYTSLVATALAAQISGKSVEVAVNTSTAASVTVRIAFISTK